MGHAALADRQVIWEPASAPQRALLGCPVFEVFFGGARGGGKTDGVLGDWAQHADQHGENAIGLMVRRTRLQLTETFERAKVIYRPLGGKFTEVPMRCVMPGGARLNFAYLERDSDAENYQGHSYTRIYIEEAGNFPAIAPIMKLMATLRSGAGVPCRIRLTGNPGGPGHQWIKARYIDPDPQGWSVTLDKESGLERVYIPSRIADNPHLGDAYVQQLKQVGDPALVKAWLDGDWNVIAGAFFECWSTDQHVIRPFAIPAHWLKFMSFDWGSARPFSCGWWAVSDGNFVDGRRYPTGALIRYREWYGAKAPNEGLGMSTGDIATGIKDREVEKVDYRVADPACWKVDGGPSHAETMMKHGVVMRRADNSRVAGWTQVRDRLLGQDGEPMMYVFSTCRDLIRTLPALQHDEHRPEDVDTEGEDHAGDDARYACMSRPWTRKPTSTAPIRGTSQMTMDEVWRLAGQQKGIRV